MEWQGDFTREGVKKMNIKKILTTGAAAALLFGNVAMPAFAAPNWELTAPKAIVFNCGGSDYAHTLNTVSQDVNGVFAGTGDFDADASYTWDIDGTIDGSSITFALVYTGANFGYTLNGNGTIANDGSISGTTDGNCSTFTMPAGSADEIEATPPSNIPEQCDDEVEYNVIEGTEASEVLNGTSGPDLILGKGGSDVINGKGGNDCIVGGNGSDAIHGQGGNDVVLGGNGSDAIQGNEGNDWLYGENGSDSIKGASGSDHLFGGVGSDSLKGDGGTDDANGGADNDYCNAEAESFCEA